MKTLVSKRFSIDQCKKNKNVLFIYGDNENREGSGGSACIRGEINSIGISSKKLPSNDKKAFYTDEEFERNKEVIDTDIERVKKYAQEIGADTYCFPFGGIGTGLALLPLEAPQTFFYLCTRLYQEFKFNNVEGAYTI